MKLVRCEWKGGKAYQHCTSSTFPMVNAYNYIVVQLAFDCKTCKLQVYRTHLLIIIRETIHNYSWRQRKTEML